ncbi:unnamed protein product [Discula destructiva]
MSTNPIPILVTGRGEPIGRMVLAAMKPEYEVVHFTLFSAVNTELPQLLAGHPPDAPSSTIGTGKWAAPPQALLLGGAYQDADIERLQKLVEDTEGAAQIPWLRVDSSKMAPPAGMEDVEKVREYGVAITERMKAMLEKLRAEGKLGQGNAGVYLV